MAAIGVIVPVYNVERYLRKCVDSILNQTFQDFEIILIDDGSTDQSGAICEEYAQGHANIRVVHQRNSGVSAARNRGLRENRSEYIAFVDADDFLEKCCLEVFYGIMAECRADLVIGNWVNVLEGKRAAQRVCRLKEETVKGEVLSREEAYRRMLLCRQAPVTLWAKLYHRRLFQGLSFPEGEICEDTNILLPLVEACDKIVCTPYAGYYYLRRKGSLMHGGMTPQHWAAVENARSLWSFIRERYPRIESSARAFYYNNCVQLINRMILDPEKRYEAECEKLRREVIREAGDLIIDSEAGWLEKASVLNLLPGLGWYRLVWRGYLWLSGKASGTM